MGVSGGVSIDAIRLDQVRLELNHIGALHPLGSVLLPGDGASVVNPAACCKFLIVIIFAQITG